MGLKQQRAPWTDREIEILKMMHNAKRTMDDVRRVLKSRSDASIRNKSEQLGIKIAIAPEPEIDEAEFKRIMKGA